MVVLSYKISCCCDPMELKLSQMKRIGVVYSRLHSYYNMQMCSGHDLGRHGERSKGRILESHVVVTHQNVSS